VPELQKVIVVYEGRAMMRNTLSEALAAMFGASPDLGSGGNTAAIGQDGGDDGDGGTTTSTTAPTTPTTSPASTVAPPTGSVEALLSAADRLYEEAQEALRTGDLATYQEKIDEAFRNVEAALGATATTTTTTGG
jgi:uncharacterized protein